MQNIWESIYSEGKGLNRYPWDAFVSFLYRYAGSQGKSLSQLRILEIGCGSGSNLWFAAREKAQVVGVDCSATAIAYAETRFRDEGLQGKFHCSFLPGLPQLEPQSFDCIIDRACLVACPPDTILKTTEALAQLIKPEGQLLSTLYGSQHSSALSGDLNDNGMVENITEGSLVDVGPLTFFDRKRIDELFLTHWKALELHNLIKTEVIGSNKLVHEDWHLVAIPSLKE